MAIPSINLKTITPAKAPVFYNPVMRINRDISIIILRCFEKMKKNPLRICDAMTGTGIRAIRYCLESDFKNEVFMNDINPYAIRIAEYNVKLNKVSEQTQIKCMDANAFLSLYAKPKARFDLIDLDPFGSPAPFLDSALRALKDDGLIAITATDMPALCGIKPKPCLRKYGSKPLRTEYCHEIAVRILLGCLASIGARHDIAIKPIFCLSLNHYIRIYALIKYGAIKADDSIKKLGYILHCFNCFNRTWVNKIEEIELKCNNCNKKYSLAGPLWLGELFDEHYFKLIDQEIKKIELDNKKRIEKILERIKSEIKAPITYYVIDKICDKMDMPTPSLKTFIKSLKSMGFIAEPTHFHNRGFKTNSDIKTIISLIKELSFKPNT